MAPGRKPWHDSPYDEHGMPLNTTYADYDNEEERLKHMVQDKPKEEIPLNDPEYQPRQMPKTYTGQRPMTRKGFNSALVDGVGFPDPEAESVDVEDPGERRRMLVEEAEEKGFTEVPELPKVEKQETVDQIKDDRTKYEDEREEDLAFNKALNSINPDEDNPKAVEKSNAAFNSEEKKDKK